MSKQYRRRMTQQLSHHSLSLNPEISKISVLNMNLIRTFQILHYRT
jgi:hypothetical protein